MVIQEKICKCIEDLIFEDYQYYNGREYHVDIYPIFYKIYNNSGYDDYIFIINESFFYKYFEIIE